MFLGAFEDQNMSDLGLHVTTRICYETLEKKGRTLQVKGTLTRPRIGTE